MNVSLVAYEGSGTIYEELYGVLVDNSEIRTLVTHDPVKVEKWIDDVERLFKSWLNGLIVGLDVKWRQNQIERHQHKDHHKVAILQICIGKECLIFKILNSPEIPRRLGVFLGDSNYRFVGVGIEHGVRKLKADYGLGVAKTEDLRRLATQKLDKRILRNTSLKDLVKEVLGQDLKVAQGIDFSRWDNPLLTDHQVTCACLDAYFSSQIARCWSVQH